MDELYLGLYLLSLSKYFPPNKSSESLEKLDVANVFLFPHKSDSLILHNCPTYPSSQSQVISLPF